MFVIYSFISSVSISKKCLLLNENRIRLLTCDFNHFQKKDYPFPHSLRPSLCFCEYLGTADLITLTLCFFIVVHHLGHNKCPMVMVFNQ